MKLVINEGEVREMSFIFKYAYADNRINLKVDLSELDSIFNLYLSKIKNFLKNNKEIEWNLHFLTEKANLVKGQIEKDFISTREYSWKKKLIESMNIAIKEYIDDFKSIDEDYEDIDRYEEYYNLLLSIYDETYSFIDKVYEKYIESVKESSKRLELDDYLIPLCTNEFNNSKSYRMKKRNKNREEYECLAA